MKNPRVSIDDLGVPVAIFTPDGNCVDANHPFLSLLGYSRQQIRDIRLERAFLSRDPAAETAGRQRLVAGYSQLFTCDGEVLPIEGEALPARIIYSVERNGVARRPSQFVVIVEDLRNLNAARTQLQQSEAARHELARRLTNAQESERLRIARELHDDIGQWLAILRIQFLRAGQPVSGIPGKRHPSVPELCGELQKLATKVSQLSHQLHSPELEYLGLATAVQSHCREFSEKYKIRVNCSCTNLPKDLDGLLALSILRVVQEALHNAAKHSRAGHIDVTLQVIDGGLSLRIADDGVGFDPEEARLAAGLGLISMRERIHLAGGEFSIGSKPGEGTRIEAHVPLIERTAAANC